MIHPLEDLTHVGSGSVIKKNKKKTWHLWFLNFDGFMRLNAHLLHPYQGTIIIPRDSEISRTI